VLVLYTWDDWLREQILKYLLMRRSDLELKCGGLVALKA
jgi:hypothetical protein